MRCWRWRSRAQAPAPKPWQAMPSRRSPDFLFRLKADALAADLVAHIGADIPRFASNNRNSGTAEENKAVVQNSIATFGTYSFSSDDNSIIFKPERNTFPNWSGTSQKRLITSATKDEL